MIEGCAGVVSAIALLPAGSADLSDVSATPAAEFVASGAAACAASVALVPVPLVGAAEVEAAVVVVAADVALLAGPVVVSMAGSDAGSPAVILAASRVTEIALWQSPAEPAAPAAASLAPPAPPAPVSCMPLAASSIASITGSVGAVVAVSAPLPRVPVLLFAPGLPLPALAGETGGEKFCFPAAGFSSCATSASISGALTPGVLAVDVLGVGVLALVAGFAAA